MMYTDTVDDIITDYKIYFYQQVILVRELKT